MSDPLDDRSARLVRWWVRRYTAGLDSSTAAARRTEIDSDLAEHDRLRSGDGWPASRVVRERLRRTLGGVPADVAWRRDRLRGRMGHRSAVTLVGWAVGAAQLILAAYLFAFALYLFGATDLADQRVLGRSPLGGFDHYSDATGAPTAGAIITAMALALTAAAIVRPVSPIMSNAVSFQIATLTVLFFWLGVWPLGIIVLVGSGIDFAKRALPPP